MANFNYNRVILGGRLTAKPELKTASSGNTWCSFTIAVNRRRGKDSQDVADFFNCNAFGKSAELICTYFGKGSCICVEGTLQNRNWTDKDGQKHYATDVIVDQAMFVDSKNESRAESQPSFASQPDEPKFDDVSNDDDLPF